jgi:hypothetical protein
MDNVMTLELHILRENIMVGEEESTRNVIAISSL